MYSGAYAFLLYLAASFVLWSTYNITMEQNLPRILEPVLHTLMRTCVCHNSIVLVVMVQRTKYTRVRLIHNTKEPSHCFLQQQTEEKSKLWKTNWIITPWSLTFPFRVLIWFEWMPKVNGRSTPYASAESFVVSPSSAFGPHSIM